MTDMGAANAPFAGGKRILWLISVLGSVYFGFLVISSWTLFDLKPFGWQIYDAYYAAILDGRFDLPARVLRYEGHYTADGTGYLYHGVAPLLTRFAFGWAWPFETFPMNGFSIWFWAVVGTLGWQHVLVTLARTAGVSADRRVLVLALCAALWVAGPGPALVINLSFYHEPIAVAFAMSGLFAAVWTRAARGVTPMSVAVVLLAVCAMVAVHARPNVAIGLYAGVVLAIGHGLWRDRSAFLIPAIIAMGILAAGGFGYLGLNALRFGDALITHGSYEGSRVVYGNVFWGIETKDSIRAAAFEEHGRLNPLRVVPNAAFYLFDVPSASFLTGLSDSILGLYRAVTEPILGHIRVGGPRTGLVMLWPLWCLLALFGIRAAWRDTQMAGLVVAVALSAIVTLAYGTITFRYRLDLWPVIATLALMGAVFCMRREPGIAAKAWIVGLGTTAFIVGTATTTASVYKYASPLRERPGEYFEKWSEDACLKRAAQIGLTVEQGTKTCRSHSSLEDAV
ncbi:hypothetical protein [Ruegeria sp. HKCCA5491]|uniref:hypothetical protein n=1 Tax=Ruegeria sp. HKCCA5491 TaxID=2682986 RepID=UPI0014889DFC|nr:hypothetical protein [Ruegeria sp. HKCCA5491]